MPNHPPQMDKNTTWINVTYQNHQPNQNNLIVLFFNEGWSQESPLVCNIIWVKPCKDAFEPSMVQVEVSNQPIPDQLTFYKWKMQNT